LICNKARPTAALALAAILWLALGPLQPRLPLAAGPGYTRASEAAILAAVALASLYSGYLLRSPLAALLVALTSGYHHDLGVLVPAAGGLLAAAVLAGIAALSGDPLEASNIRKPPLADAALRLAIASTSIAAASVALPSCNAYHALGAFASAILSPLLDGAAGLSAAALSGLGWAGLLVGVTLSAAAPLEPPRCGGVSAEVSGVLTRAPPPRLLLWRGGGWWKTGLACTRGRGTIVSPGARGAAVAVCGSHARDAALLLARKWPGATYVLCLYCEKDPWLAAGLEPVLVGAEGGLPTLPRGRGALLTPEGEALEYAIATASLLAQQAPDGVVVFDDASAVPAPIVRTVLGELAARGRSVILVYTRPPETLRPPLPPGAAGVAVLAGVVTRRELSALLPAGSLDAAVEALARGYVLIYPSCRGTTVALKLPGLASTGPPSPSREAEGEP